MRKSTTPAGLVPEAIVEEAWQQVGASFERFCVSLSTPFIPLKGSLAGQGTIPTSSGRGVCLPECSLTDLLSHKSVRGRSNESKRSRLHLSSVSSVTEVRFRGRTRGA